MADMDDPIRPGIGAVVYALSFANGSGKKYIGSAVHLPRRARNHAHLLRAGKHHSIGLQRAADKYGIHNIRVEILECGIEPSDVVAREQHWMDAHKGRLYNRSPTAGSRLGAKMSTEARVKISASLAGNQRRKGKSFPPEHRAIISAGVKRAYVEGRRKPTPQPQNLTKYMERVRAGEIVAPWAKPERNAKILASYHRTRSMKETGAEFGITIGAVSYVVRKLLKTPKGRRSKP